MAFTLIAHESTVRRAKLLYECFIDFMAFYALPLEAFSIDPVLLGEVCKRYYSDVERLHASHNIHHMDSHKIAGYTTYWLTKLKPVKVVDYTLYHAHPDFCLYINELFAVYASLGRIFAKLKACGIFISDSFFTALLYNLKFRANTGDSLAMIYYLVETNFLTCPEEESVTL